MSDVELLTASVDARELGVVTESRFFEPYKAELRELFVALGREHLWSDDPRELLAYIRPGWIGAEHGNSASKDQFTAEQEAAAAPILEKLRLSQETLPPDGAHFDDVLVVGGTTQANYRREKVFHVAKDGHGVTADRVTLWIGQRPKEERDGTLDELLDVGGRFPGNYVSSNPWVRKQLEHEWDADPTDPWQGPFATETDLGRVTMMKLSKSGAALQPHRIDLSITDVNEQLPEKRPDAPARLITDYRFTDGDGQEIVVMNAAAVARGSAPSRHTTVSCTKEWLSRHAPAQGARVLYISSNPHTLRTAQDTYLILQQEGRGDIQLVVAGASAPPNATIQLFLGEVGRLIDNDVTRNYADKNQIVEQSGVVADLKDFGRDVLQGAPRVRAAVGALLTGVVTMWKNRPSRTSTAQDESV